MLTLISTDPFVIPDPSTGEDILVDPVDRTVDYGEGPVPFTEFQENLIPTPSQIADKIAEIDSTETALDAAETLRQSMFDLTDDIIAWCTAAQQFIQTGGAQGSLSSSTYISLLTQAETLLLSHKNLEIKTDAVNDQRDWMLQRGQQAQSILALAALST
jgi:hypothetical protein